MEDTLKKIIALRDAIDDIDNLIKECVDSMEQNDLSYYVDELNDNVKSHIDNAFDSVSNIAHIIQSSDELYDLRK